MYVVRIAHCTTPQFMTHFFSHFHTRLLVDASLMGESIAPLMLVDCFVSFAFSLSFSFFLFISSKEEE